MIVSAIIVTFNPDMKLLLQQYKSVCSQVNYIVYVDNGSSNFYEYKKAIEEVTLVSNDIRFIRNEHNMGLGYAHNQGIRMAKELKAQAVLILDHDSVLRSEFVKSLLFAMKKLLAENVKLAAVGPIYINEKTKEQYPITRYWGPFVKRLKPEKQLVEASVLISSGTLIPINILDIVGGMDENLFVDYIDIEWSYRVRSMGYKLYVVPSAIMNHQIGDKRIPVFGRMVSMHSPLRRYYLSRNSIYMLKCPYVSWGYKLREFTFNIFRVIIFTLYSSDKSKYLKYSFRGILDGIKGRYGKSSLLA